MILLSRFAHSALAARICCIVLLAALAGLLTDAWLKVAYGTPSPSIAASSAASSPSPFASAPSAVPSWLAGGDSENAPTPASELKLLGIVAQGASGYALVQAQGKRPQVLRMGQMLADGTQLKSVSPKTAVVMLNGIAQTLSLDSASNNSSSIGPVTGIGAFISPAPMVASAQQIQQLQQAAATEVQTLTTQTSANAAQDSANSAASGSSRKRSTIK